MQQYLTDVTARCRHPCLHMDVVLAKATEGITPNLTSGDLGGDVEGGERDLCGEAKNTDDAQNPSSFSRLKV